MKRTILFGLIAVLCGASIYIVNRNLAAQGGHPLWTAALRYGYMVVMLALVITWWHGSVAFVGLLRCFAKHWVFFLFTGVIGSGTYYACLVFAALYAPAWVTAAAYQVGIVCSPIVLICFGRHPGRSTIIFVVVVACGGLLVNFEQMSHGEAVNMHRALIGMVLAFCACAAAHLGMQLMYEAVHGGPTWVPHVQNTTLEFAPAQVFLNSLGTLPLWAICLAIVRPGLPTKGQWGQAAISPFIGGVLGAWFFVHARTQARRPQLIAALDATPAASAVFTLILEALVLKPRMPGWLGVCGLLLMVVAFFVHVQLDARRVEPEIAMVEG